MAHQNRLGRLFEDIPHVLLVPVFLINHHLIDLVSICPIEVTEYHRTQNLRRGRIRDNRTNEKLFELGKFDFLYNFFPFQ
jgi:hypothetical protein